MKGLNLASFKKMKEDKHSATMIHENGHTLVISKGSLPAGQRKQLESLPMHSQHFDEGGAAQPMASAPLEVEAINPTDSTSNAPIQGPTPASVTDQSIAPPVDQQADIQSQQVQQQTPAQNVLQAKGPGFEEEKAANLAEAKALRKQGIQSANAIGIAQKAISNLPTQEAEVKKYNDQYEEFRQAMLHQEVKPEKYWDDHSRLAAGIGLLFSGAGGNINGALDTIQKGIDRDIDAQKNKQEQTGNLWKMNRAVLDSNIAANLATKNQYYTMAKYGIDKAAEQAKGPIALAQKQAANAKIDQAIGENNFLLSMMGPTSDHMDPATKVRFLVPPDKQKEVADQIDQAKNTVQNSQGIDEAFEQAVKDTRPFTGGPMGTSIKAFIPGMHTPGQSALIGRLAPTYGTIEGTVRDSAMKSGEQNFVPAFGDSDEAIATKRKSLQDYKTSKASSALAKAYGIDLTKYPSTNINGMRNQEPQQQAAPTRGGVQYDRKVINGKAYMVPRK